MTPSIRFLATLLLACTAGGAQAAICRAASTASGAASGATWQDTMTLPAALAASSCDEIWLKQGIYRTGPARTDTFNIPRPLKLYGGFVGSETELAQRGTNSRLTVLSGDIDGDDTVDANGITTDTSRIAGSNSYHVVRINKDSSKAVFTPADTVIDGLSITGGRANGGNHDDDGAGLHCWGVGAGRECSPHIANVTFSGNLADRSGGGMYAYANSSSKSSPEITHSTFSGNAALYGGGLAVNIVLINGATGSASIAASTFSGNMANFGGAAYLDGTSSASVEYVTFAENKADTYGGALHANSGAQAAVTASVFWGNAAPTGNAISLAYTTPGGTGSNVGSLSGSIVQGGCASVYAFQNAIGCTGSPSTSDPLLGSLQDNGGPTWTRLPGAASPALNAATCATGYTDQRGAARPTGANACDIGAVELQTSVPDAPMNGSASSDQARQVTLSWPAAARAMTYVVARGGVEVCRTSATTCVVAGLENGKFYNFVLAAVNEAGMSSTQMIPGGTLALPGAHGSVTATAGNGSTLLAWDAPSGNASAITYSVTASGGNASACTGAATSCTVTGLTNGMAYTFTVRASNAAGYADAPPIQATPVAAPGAPQGVSATPGDGSARVAWTAPASDGGSAITGYVVTANGAATACTASPCTVSGLVNGTPYTFAVLAKNAVGNGPAAQDTATPATLGNPGVALPGGGTAAVVIGSNPPGCTLSAPVTIDGNAPPGAPVGSTVPLGVLRFAASNCAGATLAVRVTYPTGKLAGLKPYKFGPPQAGQPAAWFPHGTITGDMVTYTVQDDGTGDNDTTTPGAIADPFALMALPTEGTVGIPTLSQWGVLVLSALLGLAALHHIFRKKRPLALTG